MADMKRVTHRRGILHVETPLGIVNIHVGLHDWRGRRVEAVTFHPNNYAGEPAVRLYGTRFVELRTLEGGGLVSVVRDRRFGPWPARGGLRVPGARPEGAH